MNGVRPTAMGRDQPKSPSEIRIESSVSFHRSTNRAAKRGSTLHAYGRVYRVAANRFLGKHVIVLAGILSAACSPSDPQTLITIADARIHKAQVVDLGEPGDSLGDILVFDQPLLDQNSKDIGNNSGVCVRTRVGHSFQCQWTLTLENGTIQVAGREFDRGASDITIVGGTGDYSGIRGHMQSVNNGDGTFTQSLTYKLP